MPWPTDEALHRAAAAIAVYNAAQEADVRLALEAAGLPELFRVTEAAKEYGVARSNIDAIAGLPEPVYGPDLDPPRRLRGGRLWLAEDIRRHAAERRRAAALRSARDPR